MESFGHKMFILSQPVPLTGTGDLYPRVRDFSSEFLLSSYPIAKGRLKKKTHCKLDIGQIKGGGVWGVPESRLLKVKVPHYGVLFNFEGGGGKYFPWISMTWDLTIYNILRPNLAYRPPLPFYLPCNYKYKS